MGCGAQGSKRFSEAWLRWLHAFCVFCPPCRQKLPRKILRVQGASAHTSESISRDFERRVLGRYSELQVGRPRGIRKTVRTSTPGLSLRVCDCLECHVVQQNTIRNDMERQLTSVSGRHHQFVDNTPGHTHAHNRTAFGCPDI